MLAIDTCMHDFLANVPVKDFLKSFVKVTIKIRFLKFFYETV